MPGRMGSGMAMQEQHCRAVSAMPDAQPRFRQVDHLQGEVSEHHAWSDLSEGQRALGGSGSKITSSNLKWAFGQDQRALLAVGLRAWPRGLQGGRGRLPAGVPDGKRAIEAATALAETWPQSRDEGNQGPFRNQIGSRILRREQSTRLWPLQRLDRGLGARRFRHTRFASEPGDSRHKQGQRHCAEERKYEQ
jgi:hypothetical protein